MAARMDGRWLVVDHPGGDETAPAYIGVSAREEPETWIPAFLDWDSQQRRVAKVRPPEMDSHAMVWLKVAGVVDNVGRLVKS